MRDIRIKLDSLDIECNEGTVWMDEPEVIGQITEGFFFVKSIKAKLFEYNTTKLEDTEEQFTHHQEITELPDDVRKEVECGVEEMLSRGIPVNNIIEAKYI